MKKLLLIITFFATFQLDFAYSLTLSQIRTDIRRNLRDTDSTRTRYTNAYLLDFINEAQREIVNATWLLEETSSYILTPLTTFYALPTQVIAITNVEIINRGGRRLPLNEVTLRGLNSNNPDWRNSKGEPIEYYVESASGTTQIQIAYIPIPTNTSTGTITLRYFVKADDLSGDSDVPFNGKEHLTPYHTCIVHYATARIKAIERRIDEAQFYFQLFDRCTSIARERLGSLPNYTPGMSAGGGAGRK